jgi:hypothetical protein
MTGACICGTDPAASPLANWDSSCPVHPGGGRVARLAHCPDCGHVHAGVDAGQVCTVCECLSVPAILTRPVRRHPARVQANADDYY